MIRFILTLFMVAWQVANISAQDIEAQVAQLISDYEKYGTFVKTFDDEQLSERYIEEFTNLFHPNAQIYYDLAKHPAGVRKGNAPLATYINAQKLLLPKGVSIQFNDYRIKHLKDNFNYCRKLSGENFHDGFLLIGAKKRMSGLYIENGKENYINGEEKTVYLLLGYYNDDRPIQILKVTDDKDFDYFETIIRYIFFCPRVKKHGTLNINLQGHRNNESLAIETDVIKEYAQINENYSSGFSPSFGVSALYHPIIVNRISIGAGLDYHFKRSLYSGNINTVYDYNDKDESNNNFVRSITIDNHKENLNFHSIGIPVELALNQNRWRFFITALPHINQSPTIALQGTAVTKNSYEEGFVLTYNNDQQNIDNEILNQYNDFYWLYNGNLNNEVRTTTDVNFDSSFAFDIGIGLVYALSNNERHFYSGLSVYQNVLTEPLNNTNTNDQDSILKDGYKAIHTMMKNAGNILRISFTLGYRFT